MDYEVIVCGGGPAGIGAACAAAECGAKVLLLERYGRLGGMGIHALVGPVMGRAQCRVADWILEQTGGRTIDFMQWDLRLFDLLAGLRVTILLHTTVLEARVGDGRIKGVSALCREGVRVFSAPFVVDATGDGTVAFAAGVPFDYGRTEDGNVQPLSIMFNIGGVDPARRIESGSEESARLLRIGDRSWEEIVMEGRRSGELPETVGVIRLYRNLSPDENGVNATQINYRNGTLSEDLTFAEIEGRKQAFRVLDFLKRNLPGYGNSRITSMPAVVGVRETRRFHGLKRLEKADCLAGTRRKDAIVRRALFGIDIHNPTGCGQAAGRELHETGTAERVQPYDIPYGALLPDRPEGLLLAGRNISASHEALASCRVMGIAMATGAGAGAAAAWAVRNACRLRDVPVEELQKFLFPQDE